ncbi:ATP-binding protein [Salirhabdus salicampi]|uniref:ATP-binding protein n=1 Tax=Salirhabdus salicampi TaxID=476102 RepID=UPI0020C23193|nr:ATP-binding protein [Salirhabdus salicampi]MCP8616125.1 ATP-binding protein [Salirhabdus salicampi]
MWLSVSELLDNVLFIIFPLLAYHVFWHEDKLDRQSTVFPKLFFILLISLIATMSFPVTYTNEYTYDLRIIPITCMFLYGHTISGLTLTTIMLIYTIIIDSSQILPNLIGNYFIAIVLLLIAKKFYDSGGLLRKILLITGFYGLITLSRTVYFFITGLTDQLKFTLILTLITWITLLMVLFLIEKMEKQFVIQREIQNYEKMNAVSQLAASVTHEIRNPLTTVKGFLQILSSNESLSDKNRSYVDISVEELNRAEHILNEYLSYSRNDKTFCEHLNVSKLLNNLIDIVGTYAHSRGVIIDANVEDELNVRASKHDIQQLFLNIMKNGIEAMNHGGRMTVLAKQHVNFIVIKIRDSGKGIPKDAIKKLGTPYYTTKSDGTGLGLTVCFEIIRRMKGDIQVTSKPDEGTTFTIYLPNA